MVSNYLCIQHADEVSFAKSRRTYLVRTTINKVSCAETLASLNNNETTQTVLAEVGNYLDAAGRDFYPRNYTSDIYHVFHLGLQEPYRFARGVLKHPADLEIPSCESISGVTTAVAVAATKNLGKRARITFWTFGFVFVESVVEIR